jgi:short-subunit dehydrogenase
LAGISVSVIHPGNVLTEMLTPEQVAERSKSEGFLQPEDGEQTVASLN